MNDLSAILFDLDGVLVDLCEVHRVSLNTALREITGYEIPESHHMMVFNGLPTKKKLKFLVEIQKIQESSCEDVFKRKQELTKESIESCLKVDHEKIEMLSFIKKDLGLKIACVTNAIRSTAILSLEKTGQIDYIDIVVSNEDCERVKPFPDQYKLALSMFNISAEKALAVEDSIPGKSAAYSSGCNVWEVDNPSDVNLTNLKKFLS